MHQPNLEQAIQHRHEYTRLFLHLSRQQQEYVNAKQYDELIPLLRQKEAALQALHEIEVEGSSLAECWQQERDFLPAENRQRCEHFLAETERMLAESMTLEQSATETMQHRKQETQQQLESVSRTIAVTDAYQDAPSGTSFQASM